MQVTLQKFTIEALEELSKLTGKSIDELIDICVDMAIESVKGMK